MLPNTSTYNFSFALAILLQVGTKLIPYEKSDISAKIPFLQVRNFLTCKIDFLSLSSLCFLPIKIFQFS